MQMPFQPPLCRSSPLIGRRLLALSYDLLPMLALWLLVALLFSLAYTLSGHHARENITPFSLWQWLLWLCCWCATGLYAVISWRHGGQTLGMRPWQLRVIATDEHAPHSWDMLWRRYTVASISLAAIGCGFWWAWLDPDGLTWHDRASGTRLKRSPYRQHAQQLNDCAI
ncbi:MAG TPA: RDD family protein [Xylella sp.]